ncbi:MAG: hypothetical protein JXR10_16940 [Cyclobacteriaceae bacterium]
MGKPIEEVFGDFGISQDTIYIQQKAQSRMDTTDLKVLEKENHRLDYM